MTAYFTRRLLLIIPTFLGVTIIAFTITRLLPGGPMEREIMRIRQASAGGEGGAAAASITDPTAAIPRESLEQLKKQFDLDKPGYIAYFHWLGRIVRLDLGESYAYREPVWDLIIQRLPVSMTFGITGFLCAYLISVPLGIFKALRHGSGFDFASSAVVFVGYSIPGWALGVLLLLFLASGRFFDVFPLGDMKTNSYDGLPALARMIDDDQDAVSDEYGAMEWDRLSPAAKFIDRLYHMFLPVFCYMMGSFASLTILTKNSLMENLGQDYVRTAFAKGLAPRRVIFLHTLRNSLIPLATGLGHALSYIMAGSYLIEWVFNIDGIGYLGYTSLVGVDYTVVMGVLAINTVLILMGNIFSDILYAMIDPRIRFE
jgi:microcin C transport system permease protein